MTTLASALALEQFATFGDLLRYLRRRAGLTQRELAQVVGYSEAHLCRLELNQRLPDPATLTARFLPALLQPGEADLAHRLLTLAALAPTADAPAPGPPPFKGLLPFEAVDAELFFGRHRLTAELTNWVLQLAAPETAGPRTLALVGDSGSGKTSLLRAGLLPALHAHPESSSWTVHTLTPTAHPLRALAAAVGQPELARAPHPEALARHLQAAGGPPTLLTIDHLEELFTLCRAEPERAAFIEAVLTAAHGPAVVVLVLRADFYATCGRYPGLRAALAERQLFIGAMAPDELRQAIEGPAHQGGWELEPGLVEALLRDVHAEGALPVEPGALPLLSHALLATWQRRHGRQLTLSGYTATGGVAGAIAATAEAVFHDQLDASQRRLARRLFLALTEPGEADGAPDTRRRASLEALIPYPDQAPAIHQVLEVLAAARLIIVHQDSVEIAHEALIRGWPTLQTWLKEGRAGLRQHRHLTLAAEDWDALGRDPGALYRGAHLARARELAADPEQAAGLSALERAFLAASEAQADAEAAAHAERQQRELTLARHWAEVERQRAEAQTKAARQLRRYAVALAAALGLALLLGAAAAYFGGQARLNALAAQDALRLAHARELAAAAHGQLPHDPELSLWLALSAITATLPTEAGPLPEAVLALREALAASRVRATFFHTPTLGTPLGVVLDPEGAGLLIAGEAAGLQAWGLAGAPWSWTTTGAQGERHLAVAGRDGLGLAATVAATGTVGVSAFPLVRGPGSTAAYPLTVPLTVAVFSADGRWLAGYAPANTALELWQITALSPLAIERVAVTPLSVSPTRLALAADGGWAAALMAAGVVVWERVNGAWTWRADLAAEGVRALAISPAGVVAAGLAEGGVRVWEAGRERLITGPPTGVTTITFSPAGDYLAAAGADGPVLVWEMATGRQPHTLAGHARPVTALAFSADGRWLATAGLDGATRVWAIGPQPVPEPATPLQELIALARQRLTRPPTPAECALYLHSAECPPWP